eukprot:TRINITY_DN10749_c0_g1_i1.p2 TRINITY_DN10749_c0_g1~~TRINITY_DN10749_c0_g1_i1.p2  ORF type:complete len:447 (+),score=82.96 TRINITY_DN10749_c0_g1_i1:80-1420(+)
MRRQRDPSLHQRQSALRSPCIACPVAVGFSILFWSSGTALDGALHARAHQQQQPQEQGQTEQRRAAQHPPPPEPPPQPLPPSPPPPRAGREQAAPHGSPQAAKRGAAATPAPPLTKEPTPARPGEVAPRPAAARSALRRDSLTFLFVTWSGDANGWPRVRLVVASLRHLASPSAVAELLIVVPDRDFAGVSREAKGGFGLSPAPSFPLRVATDSDALGARRPGATYRELTPPVELAERGGRGTNYRISMLVKLGAAYLVATAFYVTLDSDVFLKRPVASVADLAPGGKALLQGNDGRHRASWWRASAAALRAAPNCTGPGSGPGIGVTPCVLSTEAARGLVAHLGGHGGGWDLRLFRALAEPATHDWTEYTLYWTWACMAGLRESLHGAVPGRKLYDQAGFEWGSFAGYDARAHFADASSYFGVVQSINGAPSTDVIRRIGPLVGL